MSGDGISIAPYDPAWAERFESERAILEEALAPWVEGGVHHVGSTAIPGLASKPSLRLAETVFGLHLTEPGSDLWRERLAFRDALRADPSLRAEYQALKVDLAGDHADDLAAYTAGKQAFVARVLAGAGIGLGRR